MVDLIIFGILSLLLIILSWRSLSDPKSHGFYRFFSWECIAGLLASNYKFWFVDPLSFQQICSWTLLFCSVYMVVAGVKLLKISGKPMKSRSGNSLYQFEKTTELVDSGIYKYIRHPLYSSLIFLSWGIVLKNSTVLMILTGLLSTVLLYLTAVLDEKECIEFFGEKYRLYMKRSKRFVPFLF